MCGFGGYFSPKEDFFVPTAAATLQLLLAHRGGDSTGFYEDSASLIVHQRLAIRGLDDSGLQPRQDKLGNILAYNGELYNVPYLAEKLGLAKVIWEQLSDTEILFKFLIRFGIHSVGELEGTFSFIFYNRYTRQMILVRDRLGVKPLFYSHSNTGVLYFSSEIYPMLKTFSLSKEICQQSLSEYLWFGSCFADRTIFSSIKSVLPGEMIIVNAEGLKQSLWYKIENDINSLKQTPKAARNSVKQAITTAVGRQVVSDVPISMFLSSGVDSNILVHEIARHKTNSLLAHTAIFEEMNVDESAIAKKHAKSCGVQHKTINIQFTEVEAALRKLVQVYGEPFGDAAAIPLYLMCQRLRAEGRKVVIQGDGGDELFLGYLRYILFHKNYYNVLRFMAFLIPTTFLNLANLKRLRRWQSILRHTDSTQFALALTLHEVQDNPLKFIKNNKTTNDLAVDPFYEFEKATSRFTNTGDKAKILSLVDIILQLPSQFLTKVDRASMAANVEARVPFLDEEILKTALPLSSALNIKFMRGKNLLRAISRRRLPKYITNRKKMGFSTPYIQWVINLKSQGSLELLKDSDFCYIMNLDADEIEKLLDKPHLTHSDSFMLWKLYVLLIWYQEVLG